MATCTYDPSYWPGFAEGNSLEWVMTAGNGAYAGGSLIGGRNRTHQGYLIAALNPPTARFVVLDHITEYVRIGDTDYDLETSQHRGQHYSEGFRYLKRVTYDGTVKFSYELRPGAGGSAGGNAGDDKGALPECEAGVCAMSIDKHIALVRDENTVAIDYTLTNFSADEASVYLTPLMNWREHNTLTTREDLRFLTQITGDTLSLVPCAKDDIRIDLSISEGRYLELGDKYEEDVELQTEVDLETEGLCTSYRPYDIEITVAPGEKKHVSVVCTIESGLTGEALLDAATDRFVAAGTAQKMIRSVQEYYRSLEERAHAGLTRMMGDMPDQTVLTPDIMEFYDRLVLDADHFIAYRRSTGCKTVLAGLPWFTDWGRDTMIAFTGLTLCTGRYDDAREILKSFAMYERHGLIPNMFPDDGAEPLYNTADASLWYFIAVHHYLEFTEDDDFIRDEIWPVLTHILDAYEHGTDNSIYMESNSLIHAGSGLDQVTWMDVRVGDLVVTPRHGCPVEINALWYNALRISTILADRYGDAERSSHCTELADRVESVYESEYLTGTGSGSYLCDVIEYAPAGVGSGGSVDSGHPVRDTSIRPNQIYAAALPFSPISDETARAVVDTVEKYLYVGVGLRSLAPGHPDYHGQYRGALAKRDMSYHQGTAWGYLPGAYIDAYSRAHRDEPDHRERVRSLFDPVMRHLTGECCIGGICEIFEGDAPHAGRGCYTQAWSVGEILRSLWYNYMRGDNYDQSSSRQHV